MTTNAGAKRTRWFLGGFFALFLVLNAILVTLAVVAGVTGKSSLQLLPEDTSPAVRLLFFVIGLVLSWLVGRWLYTLMVKGDIPVGEALNTAFIFLFFLLFTFASFSFLGVLSWIILCVLFVVLLLFSLVLLWRLVGSAFMIIALLAMIVCIWLTFYMLG